MKKFLYALFAIIFIVACSKSDDGGSTDTPPSTPEKPKTEIKLDSTTSDFATEGGTSKITFTTSEAWTAEVINTRADDWCTIEPTSGAAGNAEITVTTTANDTPDDRSASIVIKAGTASKTITVSQKQKDALTVTASKFEVGADGGEVAIEVKANIDFEYAIEESAKDWVEYKTTRAMKSSNLVFDIKKNDDTEKREAKITIKSGEFSEDITIYQAGAEPTIVISQNEYVVSSDGETIAVEVASNVDVAVELPAEADWVTENTTRGMSTNTFYFDIAPSEEYDQRSAEIKFTNKDNNLSEVVKIVQIQKDALVIAKDSYTVDSDGDQIQIEVGHNVDFDVEISVDWITRVQTRVFTTETITFNVAKNPTNDNREGTIVFKSQDGIHTQIVTIYQAQEDVIIISDSDIVVSDEGGNISFEIQANIEFTVSDPDVDWLHTVTTRGLTTHTLNYQVDANTSYNPREAKIIVTDTKNNKTETITITQAQKDAIVISKSTYYFGKEGGDLLFKIQTNADISVSISEDAQSWILHPSTRAMEVQSLYFEIATCDGDEIREGIITLTAGSAEQNIKVIQNPLATTGTQIIYESSDGNIVTPTDPTKFGATIVSNEYKDGIGILTFDSNVTAIGENAFQNCTTLSRIEVPDGITSIGDYAFAGCTGLEYISLANTITSIGNYAFQNCTGEIIIDCDIPDAEILDGSLIGTFEKSQFTKVVISDWVTRIGNKAFYGCSSITSITIPSSVTEIGKSAFENCGGELTVNCNIPDAEYSYSNQYKYGKFYNSKFAKVTIGEGVAKIGSYAFYGCSSITSITIPSSLTEIGSSAFDGCSSLACDIVIPSGVSKINGCTFSGCSSIPSITIPSSVTKIGSYAFDGCSSITSITIPSSVTEIGGYAFYGCGGELTVNCNIPDTRAYSDERIFYNSKFTKVTIGEGITKIGNYAFYGCSSITSITIPSSVTEIGSYAFYGCNSLASDIVIPSGVTKINDYTFYGCSSIPSLTIPSSVTEIGNYAFSGCGNIPSLTLPNSVTEIGKSAFENCGGELTVNCNIPYAQYSNSNNYNYGKFYNSKFTKVTIGEGVTMIGSYAFDGCSSISSITIPSSVTEIGRSAFYGCSSITSDIVIPSGVTKINDYTFYDCSSIPSITIPSSVTEIGRSAFYGCSSITSDIVIPSGVTKINDYTFYDCSSITSITIPSSVTEIGKSAFENCGGELKVNCNIPDTRAYSDERIFYNSKFTKVTIGEGVTKIGSYAFYGCSSITSITIPSSVTEIGSYAFDGCSSITSDIVIPSGVTKINDYTFYGCSSIPSLTIPSSVTEIGNYAFYDCSSITSITIPSSVTEIGKSAFENCGGELKVNCNIPDANYSYYNQNTYGKFYNSKFTKVTIGEGVTKIGSYAFGNCNNISSITIPSSVTEIGSNTFENCTGEVIINCNTQNTDSIFKNSKFSIVTFGDNVTYIGGQLFYNNEYIRVVKIGAGITSIGKDAFYDCSYLHSVYCMPTTPPALEDKYVFNYNAEDRKFYVPKTSVSAYKAAANWSGYFDKIVGFQYDLGEDNGSLENPDNSDNDVEW